MQKSIHESTLIKTSFVSVIFGISLLILTGSVRAAPNDPSGGLCNGLDPSSGLYSTCIQAHSAANRVEHLTSVAASANAVSKAEAALAEAIAQFAELGGGTVPGFSNGLSDGCQALNLYAPTFTGSSLFKDYLDVTLNAGEIVHVEITGTGVDGEDDDGFLNEWLLISVEGSISADTYIELPLGETLTASVDFTVAADGDHYIELDITATPVNANITCTSE